MTQNSREIVAQLRNLSGKQFEALCSYGVVPVHMNLGKGRSGGRQFTDADLAIIKRADQLIGDGWAPSVAFRMAREGWIKPATTVKQKRAQPPGHHF